MQRIGVMGLVGAAVVVVGGCGDADVEQAMVGSVSAAQMTRAKAEMQQLADLLQADEMAGQGWPSESDGFDAVVTGGSIRPSVLIDPWDNKYVYHAPEGSGKPTILSMGPDGQEGTDDDIVYEWRS